MVPKEWRVIPTDEDSLTEKSRKETVKRSHAESTVTQGDGMHSQGSVPRGEPARASLWGKQTSLKPPSQATKQTTKISS